MPTENSCERKAARQTWNKGRLVGQKRPLKPKDVWTIRVRLQLEGRKRDDVAPKFYPAAAGVGGLIEPKRAG